VNYAKSVNLAYSRGSFKHFILYSSIIFAKVSFSQARLSHLAFCSFKRQSRNQKMDINLKRIDVREKTDLQSQPRRNSVERTSERKQSPPGSPDTPPGWQKVEGKCKFCSSDLVERPVGTRPLFGGSETRERVCFKSRVFKENAKNGCKWFYRSDLPHAVYERLLASLAPSNSIKSAYVRKSKSPRSPLSSLSTPTPKSTTTNFV